MLCPVCDSPGLAELADFPRVPLYCNVLWPTREEALSAAVAEMSLRRCRDCGHMFNAAFRPELMAYSPRYENSLHFSPHFQGYASELAARLVARYGLKGKQVVEIGCGKGDFLRMLCDLGPNRGLGFDPSYDGPDDTTAGLGISFIKDLYSPSYAGEQADLVCCRHVLEHLFDPSAFVRSLRRTLAGRPDTVIYFEVPNGDFTFEDMGIWDLIYEHYSYFTRDSIEKLFTRCGFQILDSGLTFHGQFLWIEGAIDGQEAPAS